LADEKQDEKEDETLAEDTSGEGMPAGASPEEPAAEQPAEAAPEPAAEQPAEAAPEPAAEQPAEAAPEAAAEAVAPEAEAAEASEQPPAAAPPADEQPEQAAAPSEDAVQDAGAPPEPETAPAPVDLAADARYSATGKRKSSIARVILRPGTGAFELNGHPLERYFPRKTLQEVVRQPLKLTGYLDRVDIRAKIHGGGVSSQAGAVRHGIAKALIEADPNLRAELKRRQLLTRDPRVKERRKAGLKKARKRPQFSKR
jgi:small subunit ribosomal protein S9